MPLPDDNTRWPPRELEPVYAKMREWASWYSGEPSRIIDVYASNPESNPRNPWWRFWSRSAQVTDTARAYLHVPIASDLAAVSAALLFGEMPRVRIKEAHEVDVEEAEQPPPEPKVIDTSKPFQPPAPEKPKKKAVSPAEKTEERLLQMIADGDVYSRLLEAAETAAAISGVYIYPAWDKNVRDFPIFMAAQADMAIPEFRFGFLTAVTFHRIVREDGREVWRHVEHHYLEGTSGQRKCVVLHGLYRGTAENIGNRVGLSGSPETADLQDRVDLPFDTLDVEYVPNIRPNRLWRSLSIGVADVQGSETLLDALDETYASWMRDIRLAKARIIVPTEYLQYTEGGKNPAFNIDQEVYVPMEMGPGTDEAGTRSMMAAQFAIRYLEHRATAHEFIDRIVSNAGYAPQTLGHAVEDGSRQTGTALRISEHKTILTQKRKSAFWRTALERVFFKMQVIDKEIFGSKNEPIKPFVELSDSIIDQPLELAQTAMAMKTAESASIETRVRIINPTWTEQEIANEVARIKDEKSSEAPPIVSTFGAPGTDGASTGNLPRTDQRETRARERA